VYVFKGKTVDLTLVSEDTQGGRITASESGWTNTGVALQWFKHVFIPESKQGLSPGAKGEPPHRLLIMVSKECGKRLPCEGGITKHVADHSLAPFFFLWVGGAMEQDGHSSHFTLHMMQLAVKENIHVLALPAHATHGLAPLDRTCFGPLKVAWGEEQRVEMFMTGVVRREDVVRYEPVEFPSLGQPVEAQSLLADARTWS